MRMSSLYDKARSHIESVARIKSFSFTYYQLINIIGRRRIKLPAVMFNKDITDVASERYLEKYMVPKHNGCFVDIGANIGFWTFLLARKNVTVHAFEPSPQPYSILKKSSRKYLHVHVYRYALGEADYNAKLNLHYVSGHNSLVRRWNDFTGRQIIAKVRTLDSFNLENVGLIKIDTEGYEIPVLLGAKQTIQKNKPRLIIEVHTPREEQMRKIAAILKELNYHWIIGYKIMRQPHVIGDPVG